MAYKTQFSDQAAGKDLFPAQRNPHAHRSDGAFLACLAASSTQEPFLQKEVGLVDDLLVIPVKSI
jgi:hypothetical protein